MAVTNVVTNVRPIVFGQYTSIPTNSQNTVSQSRQVFTPSETEDEPVQLNSSQYCNVPFLELTMQGKE